MTGTKQEAEGDCWQAGALSSTAAVWSHTPGWTHLHDQHQPCSPLSWRWEKGRDLLWRATKVARAQPHPQGAHSLWCLWENPCKKVIEGGRNQCNLKGGYLFPQFSIFENHYSLPFPRETNFHPETQLDFLSLRKCLFFLCSFLTLGLLWTVTELSWDLPTSSSQCWRLSKRGD